VYWSPKWQVSSQPDSYLLFDFLMFTQSYVWIGGDSFPDANFFISTAPKAEGPWSIPQVHLP
jgi:hypothetical protein